VANLRVVYDNAAERLSSIVASSTAGSLGVNNLLTNTKAEVWRSTSTTASLTIEWATGELISVVALPFCSLSSAATMRVRGYTIKTDVVAALDTGIKMACPASQFGELDWGNLPLGVNSYAFGGAAYGVIWFPVGAYEKIVVDIADTLNPLGYIEVSKIVTGAYWSPVINTEYGVQVGVQDNSRHERSDAGDLRSDRGVMFKTLSFDLSLMPAGDRNIMWNIIRGKGMSRPVFVSITPEATDSMEEQIFQIYGKLSKQGAIKYQFMNQYSTTIEIEEV
jgi:hypothetical protein